MSIHPDIQQGRYISEVNRIIDTDNPLYLNVNLCFNLRDSDIHIIMETEIVCFLQPW